MFWTFIILFLIEANDLARRHTGPCWRFTFELHHSIIGATSIQKPIFARLRLAFVRARVSPSSTESICRYLFWEET